MNRIGLLLKEHIQFISRKKIVFLNHFIFQQYVRHFSIRHSQPFPEIDAIIKNKLVDIGLPEDISEVIASDTTFASNFKGKDTEKTLQVLHNCQFGQELLVKLITAHPYILLTDFKVLQSKYLHLKTMLSNKYVYKVFLNSPDVLNDDWDNVINKLNYLQEEMCFSLSEIVNSGALKHSLTHIHLRHLFLTRTGKYKYVKPKVNISERHKINPSIEQILDSSEEYFCQKIAGVTIEEFEVFEQLLEYE